MSNADALGSAVASLKPCPFCGATPHRGLTGLRRCQMHGDPVQHYAIWCPLDCARIERQTEAIAFEEWNRRAPAPVGFEERELALKEAFKGTRPDWASIYEGTAHAPDRDDDLVTVTRETARLAHSALREINAQDFYHNNGAAQNELNDALNYPVSALSSQKGDEDRPLRSLLERLVNAKALKGVREQVAGWNGEGREEPYTRHPNNLGATIPKSNCGAIYDLDEILQEARATLSKGSLEPGPLNIPEVEK